MFLLKEKLAKEEEEQQQQKQQRKWTQELQFLWLLINYIASWSYYHEIKERFGIFINKTLKTLLLGRIYLCQS